MTDLDPEARRILALARSARTPNAADKRRVALSLGLMTAASGLTVAHAAEAASAVKSSSMLASLKLWIGGGAVVLATAGGFVALSKPQPTASKPTPAASAPVTPATSTAPVPPQANALGPVDEVPREPGRSVLPERPSARGAANGRASGSRKTDTLAQELDLLHQAQSAWRGAVPAQALSLLDEHARKYPRSELRLERGALRVLTLCELGREQAASRLARTLLRRAPNSPVRAAIEESCAK